MAVELVRVLRKVADEGLTSQLKLALPEARRDARDRQVAPASSTSMPRLAPNHLLRLDNLYYFTQKIQKNARENQQIRSYIVTVFPKLGNSFEGTLLCRFALHDTLLSASYRHRKPTLIPPERTTYESASFAESKLEFPTRCNSVDGPFDMAKDIPVCEPGSMR